MGQAKIRAARVLIVGAGGLGSPVALYLAAAGVGTLGMVDDDAVSLSNLQRQILFAPPMSDGPRPRPPPNALAALNPGVRDRAPSRAADRGECRWTLIGGYDIVADGSDNFDTRFLVNDACYCAGKPWSRRR